MYRETHFRLDFWGRVSLYNQLAGQDLQTSKPGRINIRYGCCNEFFLISSWSTCKQYTVSDSIVHYFFSRQDIHFKHVYTYGYEYPSLSMHFPTTATSRTIFLLSQCSKLKWWWGGNAVSRDTQICCDCFVSDLLKMTITRRLGEWRHRRLPWCLGKLCPEKFGISYDSHMTLYDIGQWWRGLPPVVKWVSVIIGDHLELSMVSDGKHPPSAGPCFVSTIEKTQRRSRW